VVFDPGFPASERARKSVGAEPTQRRNTRIGALSSSPRGFFGRRSTAGMLMAAVLAWACVVVSLDHPNKGNPFDAEPILKAALEQEARERAEKEAAEAKAKLEERAAQEEETGAKAKGRPPQVKDPAQAKPDPKAQRNFTDPESRIMKGADGFVQAYNAQIAVEPALQLIVGQAVTQQANDKKQLLPMIDKVKQQSGQKVKEALADSGYCSEENLRAAKKKNVDLYVATGKQKHHQAAPRCPRGPIPQSATLVDRMKRKLMTQAGRAVYALRKTIVEPVFGQIKQAQGFRQFLLRGYEKVQGEWALVCTTHNLLKLYRACAA
jgi:hypothetical protein